MSVLLATLLTGSTSLSSDAKADENALNPVVTHYTHSDLYVPTVTEDADTYVLPLDAAGLDLSARSHSTFEEAQGNGQAQRRLGKVQVQQARTLTWSLDKLSFHAEGDPANPDPKQRDVLITYTDPRTDKPITLAAQTVDFDNERRKITAVGHGKQGPDGILEDPITLTREDGTFTGNRIEYDFDDRIGVVEQARVVSEYFRLSGEKIQANKDGSYTVTKGHFTTCNKTKPDYEIAASSLTLFPNRYVSARNITLSLGGFKLIPIPSYRRSLRVNGQASGLIKPGYNHNDGLTLHLADSPLLQTHTTFDYDVSLNLKRLPTGFFLYQHDLTPTPNDALPPRGVLPTLSDPLRGVLETIAAPTYRDYAENQTLEASPRRVTFFATLQNEQYVYNRKRKDLSVSRYPEIGFRYANVLGQAPVPPAPLLPAENSLIQRVPNAPFLLDIYAGAGILRETPTNVTTGRLSTRINLASQPLALGRRLIFRAGLSDWFNLYTEGSAYNIISPEAEVDFIPTPTSVFNIGYRYLNDTGTTPFASDRRDIRHELRLQYQIGGPIAFGVTGKYDIERSRPYDAEVAVIRNLDCMQFGIAYRFRSQQFNVIFNLLPPGRNRGR